MDSMRAGQEGMLGRRESRRSSEDWGDAGEIEAAHACLHLYLNTLEKHRCARQEREGDRAGAAYGKEASHRENGRAQGGAAPSILHPC